MSLRRKEAPAPAAVPPRPRMQRAVRSEPVVTPPSAPEAGMEIVIPPQEERGVFRRAIDALTGRRPAPSPTEDDASSAAPAAPGAAGTPAAVARTPAPPPSVSGPRSAPVAPPRVSGPSPPPSPGIQRSASGPAPAAAPPPAVHGPSSAATPPAPTQGSAVAG